MKECEKLVVNIKKIQAGANYSEIKNLKKFKDLMKKKNELESPEVLAEMKDNDIMKEIKR